MYIATFNFHFDLRFSILPPAMNEVLTWHRRAEVVKCLGWFFPILSFELLATCQSTEWSQHYQQWWLILSGVVIREISPAGVAISPACFCLCQHPYPPAFCSLSIFLYPAFSLKRSFQLLVARVCQQQDRCLECICSLADFPFNSCNFDGAVF